MARIIKGRQMTARYWHGREVLKEYKQGRLVYEKSTSIPDYLCFTALESGTFTLTIPAAVTPTYLSYVEWSKDGRTWNHTDNTSEAVTIDVQVASGEKVYWRGSGKRMSYSGNNGYTSGFSTTGKFAISGHLVSILKGSDFENIDFLGATFARLFQDCSNLTSAEELILPSFTVANVFSSMFLRCTALVSAPELPPVTNLTTGCYYQMFFGCSSLTHVKCLATDISATNCLYNWLNGVSSTGTFIQASGVTWPRGASGIPTGWVDVEKRTMPQGYKQVEYLQAVKPYPSNYNAAIVGTGIVLDPSQDTIEYAVWPRFDEDGYLINGGGSTAGEMPFANTSSPTSTTAKVGFFYTLYRVNSSTNLLSTFFTRENGDGTNKALGSSLDATNKVTDNPQTIRVEFSATSSVMYLNGTQVASRRGYTVDTSDMATMQAFVLAYNNKTYSWEHPFYYLKWWRGANLIADYVPCVRESDDEVGFYDFASQTFKTRYYISSEPFTAGEEI